MSRSVDLLSRDPILVLVTGQPSACYPNLDKVVGLHEFIEIDYTTRPLVKATLRSYGREISCAAGETAAEALAALDAEVGDQQLGARARGAGS